MADPSGGPVERQQRWFQGIPRYSWIILVIAALGWMFDTFDQHLFTLVRPDSVKDLLGPAFSDPKELSRAAEVVGSQLTAVFLLGWAAGGFVFGMVGDRLGRGRTMMLTILVYALFTGLNGLVQTPLQYAICRFVIAMGVGGEFAAGASLVAETWPNRSRAMALGSLQALSALGNISAALVTLVLSAVSWRYVFYVGAIPALLVVWVFTTVKEPEAWQRAKREAAGAPGGKDVGSIVGLFREPGLRRNTIAGVLLAVAGVGGAWGVGFFLPDLVKVALKPMVAASLHVPLAQADTVPAVGAALKQYGSKVFLFQMIGAFFGMFAYAALSERIGRRPAMALVFVSAFGILQLTFRILDGPAMAYVLAVPLGFCVLAPFSAYAVYFPELFPTRLRATGVGFCYNFARILAAAAPLTLGKLREHYFSPSDPSAGLRTAAGIVACIYAVGLIGLLVAPETRGKPLPD